MSEKESAKGLNTDMMTAIYRLAVVILLAGILVVQWQILGNTKAATPSTQTDAGPTYGDWNSANQETRKALLNDIPLIRLHGGFSNVQGRVTIDSTSIAQIRGR